LRRTVPLGELKKEGLGWGGPPQKFCHKGDRIAVSSKVGGRLFCHQGGAIGQKERGRHTFSVEKAGPRKKRKKPFPHKGTIKRPIPVESGKGIRLRLPHKKERIHKGASRTEKENPPFGNWKAAASDQGLGRESSASEGRKKADQSGGQLGRTGSFIDGSTGASSKKRKSRTRLGKECDEGQRKIKGSIAGQRGLQWNTTLRGSRPTIVLLKRKKWGKVVQERGGAIDIGFMGKGIIPFAFGKKKRRCPVRKKEKKAQKRDQSSAKTP